MRKRKVSASSTATNNIAVVASSTSPGPFNLGQILAKYGYVPRATFRPNIPPPTSSVLPPLQPTTTGIGTLLNGLPQPTSYFTQPILRNVGQNENIIRQQAKETGVEVSPVLVPSSIPRITDDPRINGKGDNL
uniref:Uncharacterized protein n=1 Tax=Meloidogyne enterolobii TaxID=390850 RepID=A0A6V7VJ72_MELEN|nr:unnamed protein product [Meloidogyne enterolobii]